uniref:Uncharacterized protein n=1 Tax=Pseudomonas fluorescens (strain SBW25) TaxID=216595 RepID=A0A0G4E5E7_PSEFS|nr:hypothetical protein [Pseudomonas fluorescens]CEK42441.1 hypothetical protein PQBR55_0062 [Pseudomonas fluorescens SBW25]
MNKLELTLMGWAPLVDVIASASVAIAAVKVWILLAGVLAQGAAAAYIGWPLYESKRTDLGKHN